MNKNNEKHAEYYEAILQIRPANNEVLGFVLDLIENRNDVKVYITNQKFARGTLAAQLKRKYKDAEVTITKSLYGRHKMTSRLVYRATVLFRLNSNK